MIREILQVYWFFIIGMEYAVKLIVPITCVEHDELNEFTVAVKVFIVLQDEHYVVWTRTLFKRNRNRHQPYL